MCLLVLAFWVADAPRLGSQFIGGPQIGQYWAQHGHMDMVKPKKSRTLTLDGT